LQKPKIEIFHDRFGKGEAFSFTVSVTNQAKLKIRLTAVSVTDVSGTQGPPITPPQLLAENEGAQLTFSHAGISVDLVVSILVNFTWETGLPSSASAQQTIKPSPTQRPT